MENEKPSYYAIIPANVRYDNRLKANEKLMYGEIVCLSNKNGYCFASNKYFSELYEVSPQAISGWVKHLEKCGYISCEYLHNGTEIKERRISILPDTNSTKLEKGINKTLKGYKQNFKDNNIKFNNIKNNSSSTPKIYYMICSDCGCEYEMGNWECPKCHSKKYSIGEKKAS